MYITQKELEMRATKEHAELTRESVLKAGLQVFSEKGFAAARLDDIAREAGVTRGAIYWHFKNKLDLFCELLLTVGQNFFADAQAIMQSNQTPVEKLRELLIRIPTNFFEDHNYRAIGVLLYHIEWTDEVKTALESSFKRFHNTDDEPLVQLIEAGKAAGEFRKEIAPSIMVKTCKTFFLGLMNAVLEPHDHLQKEDIPAVVDCFLKGMIQGER